MPRIDDPWIGSAITTPEVGARLVIVQPDSIDLEVTSPVIGVLARRDGVVVHTVRDRYVVGVSGDTYLLSTYRDDAADTGRFVRADRP